jgi:hypothetical protein
MTSCADKNSRVCLIDVKLVLGEKTVPMDDNIRRLLRETRSSVLRLGEYAQAFEQRLKLLEAQDKLDNFEIQDLMSEYNEAETLASSVRKKLDDTAAAIIGKI